MMKTIVVLLAVVAGAKLFAQERLYRQGATEALIQAYRERAIAACQSQVPVQAPSPLWTRPASVELVIGRRSAAVNVWELDNTLWPARFKHPHVVLKTRKQPAGEICEYDVIEGRAYLTQL
jgi:hypothetical protein